MKRPSLSSRQLWVSLYLPTVLLAFAQGAVLPFTPLYANTFTDSIQRVSLVVAIYAFGTVLADIPVGMALERVGRRPMMLGGAVMVAGSFAGLSFAQSYPELLVYRFVGGVGAACWGLSRLAFVADVIPPELRGRSMATFGGLSRIGTFAGPALGTVLVGLFDLRAAFVLATVLAAMATAISFAFVGETRPAQSATSGQRWRVVGELLRRRGKDFAAASAGQVFAQMIRSGRTIIVPLYAATALGLSPAAVGAVVTISAIIDMSLFIPAGMLMDRLGRKFASVPSFLVMGIGMALLPLAFNFPTLLAVVAIIGLGNGLGSGTMMTLGADLAPKEAAGEFLGLWRVIGDAGQMGGPLAVGAVAEALDLATAALVLGGIGVLSAAIIWYAVEETLDTDGRRPLGVTRRR